MKPSDHSELELLHKNIVKTFLGKNQTEFEKISGPVAEFFYYLVRNMFSLMEIIHSE